MDEPKIPVVHSNWAEPVYLKGVLTFNDETTMPGDAVLSPVYDELIVMPLDESVGFIDLVTIFSNPEKTSMIACDMGSRHREYTGYTRLAGITSKTDGSYSIRLTKPIE